MVVCTPRVGYLPIVISFIDASLTAAYLPIDQYIRPGAKCLCLSTDIYMSIAIASFAVLTPLMAATIGLCFYFKKKKRGQKHDPEDTEAAISETSEVSQDERDIFIHAGSFTSMHNLLGCSIRLTVDEEKA